VRKFVFSGVIHPSISAMVNHRAKQSVEEALYGSSMDFTVLQPAMFISVKVCWVDYRDVAEVAALAMTGDELSCGVFELCAPGMVDRVQMAAMISEETGDGSKHKRLLGANGRPDYPKGRYERGSRA
jgi:nucleoside-diphosphate-sugar epimerase